MAMTVSLTVGGNERSTVIDKNSFQLQTNYNGKPDTLNFIILSNNPADTFVPNTNDDVVFTVDGTVRFQGDVVRVNQRLVSKEFREIQVECINYSWEANKGEPIAEIYENVTVNSIIAALLAGYPQLATFTDTNVNCPIVVDYFFIDHQRFTNILERLADQVGYNFYIDKDKDIHFFAPGAATELAGFDIEDNNQTIVSDTLQVSEDGDQIINSLVIEGDLYDASETDTENFTATAGQTEFNLANYFSGVNVTVNAAAKTVGTNGLNDAASFDCLYDYPGKKVVFTVALNLNDAVVVTGTPQLPVLIQVDDPTSIATYGILSKKEKNTSLKTLNAAKEYAYAQLSRYADEAFSGSFQTYYLTLRAGKRIRINSTILGINKLFDIISTSTRWFSEDRFVTQVQIASAEQIDAIGVLARLIAEKDRSTSASSVLNLYKLLREDVTLADTVLQDQNLYQQADDITASEALEQAENKVITWVHSPYFPATFADTKRAFLHDWTADFHS